MSRSAIIGLRWESQSESSEGATRQHSTRNTDLRGHGNWERINVRRLASARNIHQQRASAVSTPQTGVLHTFCRCVSCCPFKTPLSTHSEATIYSSVNKSGSWCVEESLSFLQPRVSAWSGHKNQFFCRLSRPEGSLSFYRRVFTLSTSRDEYFGLCCLCSNTEHRRKFICNNIWRGKQRW